MSIRPQIGRPAADLLAAGRFLDTVTIPLWQDEPYTPRAGLGSDATAIVIGNGAPR